MLRSRTRPSRHGARPQAAGKHARNAPRLIGYGILLAAFLFIVIGLFTA
jgi:hypothetical protein